MLGSLPEEEGGVLGCLQHFQDKSRGKQGLRENIKKLQQTTSEELEFRLFTLPKNQPTRVQTVPCVKTKEAEPGAWRERLRMVRFVGLFFPLKIGGLKRRRGKKKKRKKSCLLPRGFCIELS